MVRLVPFTSATSASRSFSRLPALPVVGPAAICCESLFTASMVASPIIVSAKFELPMLIAPPASTPPANIAAPKPLLVRLDSPRASPLPTISLVSASTRR